MEKKDNLLNRILYIGLALAVLFSIVNIFLIQERKEKLAEAREVIKEQLRPAELEVIKLTLTNCNNCYDIEKGLEELKKQNINITKEESLFFDSTRAKELITKYNIKKFPTLIISGEINKSEQLTKYFTNVGEIIDNIIIYKPQLPHYDDILKKVIGLVPIINIVDSSCKDCASLADIPRGLKLAGIVITDEKSVDYNSKEGQDLIKEFGVRQVPAILISKEIDNYEIFKQELPNLNLTEKKGFYAVHSVIPPYRDLNTDSVVGLVDIILLIDNSCIDCYNVNVNKQVLKRFGIAINSEKTYDINSKEGAELKNKYKITKVPILIVSPEAKVYANFVRAWNNVGTIEKDSWFIMRKPEILGKYKDVEIEG
ncbi:MAG: hypothetical protein AABX90_03545 [Nanoarchaeota archaeon]